MRTDAAPEVKRRVGRKLALAASGLALAMTAALVAVVIPLERAAVERSASDQVGLLVEAVAATYQNVDLVANTHHADNVLLKIGGAPNVSRVSVLGHDGTVVWSTHAAQVGQKKTLPSALRDVRIGGDALVVTHNIRWTKSCVGCHDARQDPVGAVQVSVDREVALASLERFHLFLLLGVLIAFGVLIIALVILADRMVSRPVYELARMVARAEQGDFLVRARTTSDDEIGALAQAFNNLLRAITDMKASEIDREADLRAAREELSLKEQLQEVVDQLAATNADLNRRVQAQELLMEAAHLLASTLEREELVEIVQRLVTEKLKWPDFAIFLMEQGQPGSDPVLRVVAAGGAADVRALREADFMAGQGITGLVAETGAPYYLPDVKDVGERRGPDTELLGGTGGLLCIPMLHKGRVVGVMDFFRRGEERFDDDDLQLLQALAAQLATAVVNAELFAATVELSVTDPLTGLMNRRALQRRLDTELVRAQRFGFPLCFLMIDVDHFKQYNDRMGHLLGDEALKAVARTLAESVRKVDAVARFGGEEFCVFLPRTSAEQGAEVAEKLRAAVQAIEVQGADQQPLGCLSMSIGLAVFPTDLPAAVEGALGNALIDAADRAVYAAKARGRNRVVRASELAEGGRKPDLEPGRGETGI